MENFKTPFKGIKEDLKGRASCYKQDWIAGIRSGIGILAPITSIFFASALPVIAFGEQLNRDTGGSLSPVDTLASTALCGILHSIFGGQPLMIVGVAEPTVLMYTYLYNFAKNQQKLGQELFLAWTAWICVWAALFLFLLAIFNACTLINRFTRIAGESFITLIAALFIQEAIKGLVSEFKVPKSEDNRLEKYQFQWLYTNGLLGIIFAFGLVYTALKTRKARSWLYGPAWIRSLIADYGVISMVLVWTAISFSVPSKLPSGVPRRLLSSHLWESESVGHWSVITEMVEVPVTYIFAAIVPAVMLAGLYFFDHSIASKLAQQKEFNLKNPSAYHYDILLLAFMTLLCGLIGLPPSNGFLPQSPMHTKSLAVFKRQVIRRKMVKSAEDSMKKKASNSEIYGNMQDVFVQLDTSPLATIVDELEDMKNAVINHEKEGKQTKATFDAEKLLDPYLPIRVNEQRLSNLMQSLLIATTLFASPAINLIPRAVLWGYFAYMAINNVPGTQFCDRMLLLFMSAGHRLRLLGRVHPSFLESVPFRSIVIFTLFQFVFFVVCLGVTWIPIAGILFPLLFFLLMYLREYLLPNLLPPHHLQELDAAEYEEIVSAPPQTLGLSLNRGDGSLRIGIEEAGMEMTSAEILDELMTNRGEIKLRSYSFPEDRRLQVYPRESE